MRLHENSYGTNRENKRRRSIYIIGIVVVALFNIVACTPALPIEEENKPEFEGGVSDWGNHETGTGSTDSGRDMTHEDSIRFGYIPREN